MTCRLLMFALVGLTLPGLLTAEESDVAQATTRIKAGRVTVTATETPAEVAVRFDASKEPGLWKLPKEAGRVTELAVTPWLSGIAVAVETTTDGGKRRYYWGTTYVNPKDPTRVKFNDGFILRSETDFDLAIRATHGDSIYVTLLAHDRQLGQELTGYAYIHNCPVLGSSADKDDEPITGVGRVFSLHGNPVDAQKLR